MPKITCPRCGAERVVVEGKAKNCRKCGERLTTIPAKASAPAGFSPQQLAARFPRAVASIEAEAMDAGRAGLLDEIRAADEGLCERVEASLAEAEGKKKQAVKKKKAAKKKKPG